MSDRQSQCVCMYNLEKKASKLSLFLYVMCIYIPLLTKSNMIRQHGFMEREAKHTRFDQSSRYDYQFCEMTFLWFTNISSRMSCLRSLITPLDHRILHSTLWLQQRSLCRQPGAILLWRKWGETLPQPAIVKDKPGGVYPVAGSSKKGYGNICDWGPILKTI